MLSWLLSFWSALASQSVKLKNSLKGNKLWSHTLSKSIIGPSKGNKLKIHQVRHPRIANVHQFGPAL